LRARGLRKAWAFLADAGVGLLGWDSDMYLSARKALRSVEGLSRAPRNFWWAATA